MGDTCPRKLNFELEGLERMVFTKFLARARWENSHIRFLGRKQLIVTIIDHFYAALSLLLLQMDFFIPISLTFSLLEPNIFFKKMF